MKEEYEVKKESSEESIEEVHAVPKLNPSNIEDDLYISY